MIHTDKDKILSTVIPNLEKNLMQAFYVDKKEDVIGLLSELVPEGSVVTHGGSATLKECGVTEYLKNGRFRYLDRSKPNLSPEEVREVYLQSFNADFYFSSSNAITENGELYNVDGNSNRIAAIAFGPRNVIIIAGYNKIVKNIDAAVKRVKTVCAPLNCKRLSSETCCEKTGQCISMNSPDADMPSGCSSPGRICCNYLVSAQQRHKNRIKVIIVGEELGY